MLPGSRDRRPEELTPFVPAVLKLDLAPISLKLPCKDRKKSKYSRARQIFFNDRFLCFAFISAVISSAVISLNSAVISLNVSFRCPYWTIFGQH